jgi:hypothetical protein
MSTLLALASSPLEERIEERGLAPRMSMLFVFASAPSRGED